MQWLVSRTEPGDCQNNGAAIGTQEQAHENPPHRNLGLRTGSNCSPQSPHRMVVNRSSFPHFWHLFLAGSLDFTKIARARHGGANRHWTRSGSWAVAPVPQSSQVRSCPPANNRRWIWGRNAKRETEVAQPLKPLGGGELRSLQTVGLRRLIARCQQPRSFNRRMKNEGATEASLRATRLRLANSQRSVSEKDKKDRNIVANR